MGSTCWTQKTARFIIITSTTQTILISRYKHRNQLEYNPNTGKRIFSMGPYVGGNFWATPEGNGFSQTHADNNGDGICDVAYAVNKEDIDYLPLAGSRITN